MSQKLSDSPTTSAAQPKNGKIKKIAQKILSNGISNGQVQFKRPETKHENIYPQLPAQKSLLVTYILWLFGGFFGLHHIYLHRDRHAFVWWCTLGGYFGIGWLFEVFKIPGYVRDANEDPKFISEFIHKLRTQPKPVFSTVRFLGEIMVGYLFGTIAQIAVPEDEVAGINWKFLYWCIPFFTALGVWLVGNIGRERGVFWHCLVAAYIIYPIRYFIYDESVWFTCVVFGSTLTFEQFSKQWRREPPKRHKPIRRVAVLSTCVVIYLLGWSCYFVFNGKIKDDDGDEISAWEALKNVAKSPWWTDLKQTLIETWNFAQHNGWYETWKQVVESIDVDGEQNSYKVLGVDPTCTQSEITSAWRKLSREFHPDKVKDEKLRPAAQEKFMEIQQAYEVLSKMKSKRRSRNKKFTDEELAQQRAEQERAKEDL